jgi:hypothetical protein
MLRKLTLVIAAVAFIASPAFAAVQNVKVSGNIDSSYIMRDRFDLGNGVNNARYNQSFALTQTQLRVDADLSDNVQTVLQLLNERAWGDNANSDANKVDINLAYVTLKEFLYSPLTVVVGRQILHYGNGFIVGDGGPNNSASGNIASYAADLTKATAHDAVKAILDYKPLTIDVFTSKEDSKVVTGTSAKNDDIDLFGVNANYQLGDDMNSVVEAYFFGKINRSNNVATTTPRAKTDKVYVPGLRASTNPISGLNVQGEVAWQRGTRTLNSGGSVVNEQREAFGAQAIVNYQVKQEDVEKYKPVMQGVYTFVSGDSNPTDADITHPNAASQETFTGWDPMFEAQASGKIYNAMFNLSNAHIVELSTSVTPIEDVMAKLSWTGIWLDKSLTRQAGSNGGLATGTILRSPGGTAPSTTAVTSNLGLGQEIDADLTYNYTEDVLFGLNLGVFFPGDAFAETSSNSRKSASQAIAHVGVTF